MAPLLSSPPPRSRVLLWIALGGVVVLWLIGGKACSDRTSVKTGAELRLENVARASWRISVARVGGEGARSLRVSPRGTETVPLEEGAYLLTQTLLDIQGHTVDHRTVRLEVEEGKTYVWPLVSLQSTPEEAERP